MPRYRFRGNAPQVAPSAFVADTATLIVLTASLLTTFSMMLSQAIEHVTRAFYARCDLDLYEGRGHGFFNLRPNKPSKDFYATTKSLDRFLTSLGYLEGEPTVKEFFKKN